MFESGKSKHIYWFRIFGYGLWIYKVSHEETIAYKFVQSYFAPRHFKFRNYLIRILKP
mgnify:CR=1 FL=1